MRRTTVVWIVFWIAFIPSLGIYKYFPVIDTVWVIALQLVLLGLAVFTLTRAFRHHTKTGEFSYQGYPKWLLRVRRIGQHEVCTVEEIRENSYAETMYWIQLGGDFATRVWAKESELELSDENRVMAHPIDVRDKHIGGRKRGRGKSVKIVKVKKRPSSRFKKKPPKRSPRKR